MNKIQLQMVEILLELNQDKVRCAKVVKDMQLTQMAWIIFLLNQKSVTISIWASKKVEV